MATSTASTPVATLPSSPAATDRPARRHPTLRDDHAGSIRSRGSSFAIWPGSSRVRCRSPVAALAAWLLGRRKLMPIRAASKLME